MKGRLGGSHAPAVKKQPDKDADDAYQDADPTLIESVEDTLHHKLPVGYVDCVSDRYPYAPR